jgi:hypothetical protein
MLPTLRYMQGCRFSELVPYLKLSKAGRCIKQNIKDQEFIVDAIRAQ